MAYSTASQVRTESGFDGNSYVLDADITAQVVRADALINSYVGARYAIPNASDPEFAGSPAYELIHSVSLELATAYLLISEYGADGRDTDKDGYRRQSNAERLLGEIRDGKIALFGNSGSLLPGIPAVDSTRNTIRGFVPENPGRFSVDDTF